MNNTKIITSVTPGGNLAITQHSPLGISGVALDGPQAWDIYQRLEQFIKAGARFPEAILAFEFDEGFAGEEPTPTHAWEPHLLSPCCGSEVEGIYVEYETVTLNLEEVHDDGTVWLNSSDGDGNTLLYVCASCNLGVSLPAEINENWG
jgi:hypothetical protein